MSSSKDCEMRKKKNLQNIKELIKYGFWGAVTTGINLLAFFILESMGIYYITANIVSYIFAVILNYILNKKFVFNSHTPYKNRYQFLKFVIVRLGSLLIDNLLFYILVSVLHFNVNISKILLSLVIIIATFGVNKVFVFNRKDEVTSK